MKWKTYPFVFIASGVLLPVCALPQTADQRPSSVTMKLGDSKVTITVSGGDRVVVANGLPDHAIGQFPGRGNPNRISAQNYNFHLPVNPKVADQPTRANGAWFGVALNGVPFEPGTAEFWNNDRAWNFEAKSGFIDLGLDANNAHVQPSGAYHYHGLPTGLMAKLGGDGKKMLLVGYAADGFPIYTSQGHKIATNAASPLTKLKPGWQLKPGERTGGPGGMKGILDHAGSAIEEWWTPMSQPRLTSEVKQRLVIAAEEAAAGQPIVEWVAWRDEQLVDVLKLQAASELREPK